MLVALERFDLRIRESHSLKQKRHVVKTLTNGIRSTFKVSVAEVDHQDLWQRATLALACVSGDSRHANEVISKALDFIEDNLDGYVTDIHVEVL